MLTKDPALIKWFDHPQDRVGLRVFGFYCGYDAVLGKSKTHMDNPEYQLGGEEGKSLRFDEMKAAARAQGWKIG